MRYWVFTIGTRDDAPDRDWYIDWKHHLHEMWFSKTKPPKSVSRGDRALIYGSQGKGFLAVVEVTDDDHAANPASTRYPFRLGYRLLITKIADDHRATPESAGINPNKIVRGPHTEISPEEYERGVESLLQAARLTVA